MANTLKWLDAHLDLAFLELEGRDMIAPLSAAKQGPQPAAVTLKSLSEGGVDWAFATVFTGPGFKGPGGYPSSKDIEGAHNAGVEQLEIYERWEEEGLIALVRSKEDLESTDPTEKLNVILLMEGADPIRHPDEALWWHRKGIRLVGLTWATGSRYAGGNSKPGKLTDKGRDLVAALDELGIIHDLSHLADEAESQLLELTDRPVVASHSNVRSLLDGKNERHLTDEVIKEVGERGGVVGLNLFNGFIVTEKKRASLDKTLAHVEKITEIMGHRRGVGLGSDMDGGFGADQLPIDINEPKDLKVVTEGLAERGWSEQDVDGFASGNWLDFLRKNL
jgi:membrane dipeptidase